MIQVRHALTVSGDEISVDLDGTDQQIDLPLNMPFVGTVDIAIYVVVRSILLDSSRTEHVPANSGLYRPITITAPRGTLVNPNYPAPVIARFCPGNVLAATVMRALSEVVPTQVSAGIGNLKVVAYSGLRGNGDYWVYMDITEGSYGGRYRKDGLDAVDTLYANTRNNPIEDIEAHYPLRVRRYELSEMTAGPGAWRGGHGSIRDIEFREPGGFSMEGDGNTVAPSGLFGGLPGTTGQALLNPDNERASLAPMSPYRRAKAGDVLRTVSPSGGGYGEPFERDPEAVLSDVLDELISVEAARSHYGVVIASHDRSVDAPATARLREARRAGGNAQG